MPLRFVLTSSPVAKTGMRIDLKPAINGAAVKPLGFDSTTLNADWLLLIGKQLANAYCGKIITKGVNDFYILSLYCHAPTVA